MDMKTGVANPLDFLRKMTNMSMLANMPRI